MNCLHAVIVHGALLKLITPGSVGLFLYPPFHMEAKSALTLASHAAEDIHMQRSMPDS